MIAAEPYLKTQRVAETLGVSASTVKRWVDTGRISAVRTIGKHRLIPVSEALRLAREQGIRGAQLDLFTRLGSAKPREVDGKLRERLFTLLRDGNDQQAKTLIQSVYRAGGSAADLADQLVCPVMVRIGHGWFTGAIDVYQEHSASLTVASAVHELISSQEPQVDGFRPLAVGAAPEGDPYVLPPLLGELLLREMGWDVRNLGVNLPLASLASAVRIYRPQLVYLCVSHLRDVEGFVREYNAFYEAVCVAGSPVIIGGQALGPDVRARLIYTGFGDRMVHLQEFARRFSSVPAPGASADHRSTRGRPSA